jgi:ribonuclease P protein component
VGLPKANRLRRREDFSRLYQQGARYRSASFSLRTVRRSPLQTASKPGIACPETELPPRIGISISVKVDKRSVVRNRIRRQIQSIFRQFLPRLAAGWDLLIVVHPQAVQCDYLRFLQELEQLLVDAEVLNGHQRGCVL